MAMLSSSPTPLVPANTARWRASGRSSHNRNTPNGRVTSSCAAARSSGTGSSALRDAPYARALTHRRAVIFEVALERQEERGGCRRCGHVEHQALGVPGEIE